MPRLVAPEVKLTRTALAGGGTVVIEESLAKPGRRVLDVRVQDTQSQGNAQGVVVLRNDGFLYDTWASGDVLKVEAKRPDDSSYATLLEGNIGEPVLSGGRTPRVELEVLGLGAVVDLVNLAADKEFTDTAWDAVFSTLVTDNLSGYTVDKDTDPAKASYIKFTAGMKVREALDFVRRALIGETGLKWEVVFEKDAGVNKARLKKRATTDQRTVKTRDILDGARRRKGSFLDVINKAYVQGATVPSFTQEKTALAQSGTEIFDATTKRYAQPFIADDTPVSAVALKMDRSVSATVPTLRAVIARNTDVNLDEVIDSFTRASGATRIRTSDISNPENVDDNNRATEAAVNNAVDNTFKENIVWDLGTGKTRRLHGIRFETTTSDANTDIQVEGSNDDSAWTVLITVVGIGTKIEYLAAPPSAAYRYYRLRIRRNTGAGASAIKEFALHEFGNLSTDATNPKSIHDRFELSSALTVATTGTMKKEIARFDMQSARQVAKLVLKHSESATTDLLVTIETSSDGTNWTEVVRVPASSTVVTDEFFYEGVAIRYVRFMARDGRTGGSASATFTVRFGGMVFQFGSLATDFGNPLKNDEMLGSEQEWTIEDLVAPPGVVMEKEWPAPRVVLIKGLLYWLILQVTGTADASHKWILPYAQPAGAPDALKSTDSGATWAGIAADVTFLYRLKFNIHALTATAEDAASQTKYANVAPSGVLAAAILDEALVSQEAVDQEAAGLVKARKDVNEALIIPIPLDFSVTKLKRITLDPDVKDHLGVSGAQDVVEVAHDLGRGVTVLTLNEHPPSGEAALRFLAGATSARRL